MVEIVAEISGNHGGELSKVLALLRMAQECGCDYAKFQFYHPLDMPDYLEHQAMYEKLSVPDEWLPRMFTWARALGIGLFASVFSARAARELLKYDSPYIKIASPDSTRLTPETYQEIVATIPATRMVIVSSDFKDRKDMWYTLGPGEYGLFRMYCPPGHPPNISRRNLDEFSQHGIEGFSDHTSGIEVPLAFIRRGAQMIEKHFKLDGDKTCIDANFSANPQTMKLLCRLAHDT